MLANLEETPTSQPPFIFGTISCGADTWKSALSKGRQAFSMDSRLRSDDPKHRTNFHRTNWSKYPNLDLLIINNTDIKSKHHWETEWGTPARAKNLLVFHAHGTLTSQKGNWFKNWCKDIKGRGYTVHSWHIEATECGASIWTPYFVTFCYSGHTTLPLPVLLGTSQTPRACRNLIRTYGATGTLHPLSSMKKVTSHTHNNMVGTLYGQPVYHWDGPFSSVGHHSWILIPDYGIRKVQMDELER